MFRNPQYFKNKLKKDKKNKTGIFKPQTGHEVDDDYHNPNSHLRTRHFWT